MGVFDIEDLELMVKNPRKCTTCRECLRHSQFEGMVDLGKKKDVFEFHVESLGIYKP
jgi:DNA-directed RNA polymerase I and III subunit RPAC1